MATRLFPLSVTRAGSGVLRPATYNRMVDEVTPFTGSLNVAVKFAVLVVLVTGDFLVTVGRVPSILNGRHVLLASALVESMLVAS